MCMCGKGGLVPGRQQKRETQQSQKRYHYWQNPVNWDSMLKDNWMKETNLEWGYLKMYGESRTRKISEEPLRITYFSHESNEGAEAIPDTTMRSW